MTSPINNTIQEVKTIFNDFLIKNKQRKTPERHTVLEHVYKRNDHFDADTLFLHLKNNHHNISRATVYNTLELLVACDLVKKHQFGKNVTLYEKSYSYHQHDHLICLECRQVIEFCDPRIQQIKTMVGKIMDFKVSHHALNMYGTCGNCQKNDK